MKLRNTFLLFIVIFSIMACRLSSDHQILPGIDGEVPPRPVEDYGVLCFVEFEDFILADAPVYDTFYSQDGGLSWQPSDLHPTVFSNSGCTPNIVLQKELWAVPDGSVRFRFEAGKSIEISYDQGASWKLAIDLSGIEWNPGPPEDSEREIIVKPGPLDAMIDPYSGNLLLAMGHTGVLVRELTGEWHWVSVGQYQAPEIVSTPEGVDEQAVDNRYLLPSFEQIPAAFEINSETRYVDAMLFTPDGTQLATSGFDGGIKLFDFPGGELQHWLQWGRADRYDRLYGAVFSDDGETLITCGTNVDQMLRLWDVESWTLINQFGGYQTSALDVGTYDDEQVLVVAKGQQVVVFSFPDGDQITSFESQLTGSKVTRLRLIPESNLLALGGTHGGLEVWNFEQQEIVFTLQPDREDDGRIWAYRRVVSLGDDPLVMSLLALQGDGKLTAWDISAGEMDRELALQTPHSWLIFTAAFSDDGRMVAVGMHHGPLLMFDTLTGMALTTQWTNRSSLMQLAFSPDGDWLAAGYADGRVKIWQVEDLIHAE